MIRAFTFRLLPNATQRAALERILTDNCETYNAALQQRRDAWRIARQSITYRVQQDELTALRADGSYDWLACDIMRDPLRRVDRAFKAFFRRVKAGQKAGYPRFRSRDRYDSFTFTASKIREKSLRIPNVGDIRMRGGRPISGRPKTCTVRREGARWVLQISCDIGEAPEKQPVSRAVGIDVGVKSLVSLSDGTQIDNPRWTRQHENRIAACARRLSTKQRRSRRRARAREVLRKAHAKAANARSNFLHHVSKFLVQNYDLIAHEDLRITNMACSASGTFESPGKNVAQKSGLNRSIMDAAWGILLRQLAYKAEEAGRYLIAVSPRNTSQICSRCGQLVPKTLGERRHVCVCGADLDRDVNAAKNVLRLGEAAFAKTRAESMLTAARESCI